MLKFGWQSGSVPDGFSSQSGLYLIRARWNESKILCAVTEEVLEDILQLRLPADKEILPEELSERLRAKFSAIATEERLLPQVGSIQKPGFILTIKDF